MSLDWLADAGLTPVVLARLTELEAALWDGTLDADLLHLVRGRTAQLIGDDPTPGDTTAPTDERSRVVLQWAEQFVIDPHGITDASAAALTGVLDGRQCAELTTAVAVFEALARARVALKEG